MRKAYQEQEKREIASFVETLKANGVAVNDSVFQHRIMQLLNIDVRSSDQSDEGYQDMAIRGQLMEYVLCPQGNFIKSGMELLPNEQISLQNMLEESRNPGSYIYNVIALNKILFMNEANSAIYIVSDEYLRDLASDIVVLFCYESNRKLIEYVITQQDEHLRYADYYVTNLLFNNTNQIRVDFLSEINRQRPELIEKLISIMLDERDRIISVSEDRIDEALAFLFDMRLGAMDHLAIKDNVVYQRLQQAYNGDKELLGRFQKEKYYFNFILKRYSDIFISDRTNTKMVIIDPDGYTNMRSGAGTNFDVVMQIPDGDEVRSLGLSGDWWRVTYNNIEGYVHKSRISIEESN